MRFVLGANGWGRLLSLGVLAALAGAPGCRRAGGDATNSGADTVVYDGTGGSTDAEPGPPPGDWPRILVIGPGDGPGLFIGSQANAAGIGFLNPGVRVRLESSVVNGRVRVLVGGALATKGWVPLERVGAYAQARGRVEGTRAYVGPGDFVGIVGSAGPGQMRVRVRPWLGGHDFLGPFEGTMASDALGDRPPEGDVEGVSEGECFRLPAGQTLPITGSPTGEPVATLPSLDPALSVVVLRQRDDLFGVRAGFGPYITGYVRGALEACEGDLPTPAPLAETSDGERPHWIVNEQEGAVHRVAAGTRVRSQGETIGRLRADGWARELARPEPGRVDVFIAVNDDVAIRGTVPESALTLVEGEITAEPEPEEELPDELQ